MTLHHAGTGWCCACRGGWNQAPLSAEPDEEISKSAEIWNRSRSLRTIDMLNSRSPVNTSLTRLAVPKGARDRRETGQKFAPDCLTTASARYSCTTRCQNIGA